MNEREREFLEKIQIIEQERKERQRQERLQQANEVAAREKALVEQAANQERLRLEQQRAAFRRQDGERRQFEEAQIAMSHVRGAFEKLALNAPGIQEAPHKELLEQPDSMKLTGHYYSSYGSSITLRWGNKFEATRAEQRVLRNLYKPNSVVSLFSPSYVPEKIVTLIIPR
jgi:hypothetical protein